MRLLVALTLVALVIPLVVWATEKVSYQFWQRSRKRYYLTGVLITWPLMIIELVRVGVLEVGFSRRYFSAFFTLVVLFASLNLLAEEVGALLVFQTIVIWAITGWTIWFCRHGDLRELIQAACVGLAIAVLALWHNFPISTALVAVSVGLCLLKRVRILRAVIRLDDPRATI